MSEGTEQQASEMVERDVTPERYGPGTFGCHEALDRTSILTNQVFELAEHGAILLNDEWRNEALKAAEILYGLYQSIGSVHLEAAPVLQISPPAAVLDLEATATPPDQETGLEPQENRPTRDPIFERES